MYYVGIDLGGTNIKAGIVDGQGKILAEAFCKTQAQRPYQDIVRDMAGCVMQALKNAKMTTDDILSVGIGIPGYANQKTGTGAFCTNLGWYAPTAAAASASSASSSTRRWTKSTS